MGTAGETVRALGASLAIAGLETANRPHTSQIGGTVYIHTYMLLVQVAATIPTPALSPHTAANTLWGSVASGAAT